MHSVLARYALAVSLDPDGVLAGLLLQQQETTVWVGTDFALSLLRVESTWLAGLKYQQTLQFLPQFRYTADARRHKHVWFCRWGKTSCVTVCRAILLVVFWELHVL